MQLGKHHLSMAVLALLALTAPSLTAAADLKFGMQFGLAVPTGGDLKKAVDNSLGAGLGFFMLAEVAPGHVLRPRLDLWAFKGTGSAFVENNITFSSLGVDYLYYFDGTTQHGIYAVVGGGISDNKQEIKISANRNASLSFTESSTKPYFNLGGGYQFNKRWGAEVRLNGTKFENKLGKTASLNTVQVTATLRF